LIHRAYCMWAAQDTVISEVSVLLQIEFENFSSGDILVASPTPEQRKHYNERRSFQTIACKSEQYFSPMKKLTQRSQMHFVTTFQDMVNCHRATLNCPTD